MTAFVGPLRFLMVIEVIPCALTNECHTVVDNTKILPRFHCFTDSRSTHHHLCRLRCLINKPCSFVQYNTVENHWLVANGPCLWLEPDTNYNVTFMRTKAPVTQKSTSKSRAKSYENLVDVVVSGNFWSIVAWPCFVTGYGRRRLFHG